MKRIERDLLGERELTDDVYYGVQTLRGKDNFHITGIPMSREPYFVKAFGYVKKAAAMANRDLGVLDAKVANAIIQACDRLIAGELLQFLDNGVSLVSVDKSHLLWRVTVRRQSPAIFRLSSRLLAESS
jgi:aspartate ammonia-lyase